MQPFILTIAVFVFLSGAVFGNRNVFIKSQNNAAEVLEKEEVLAETDENAGGDVSPTAKPFPKLITIVPLKPSPAPINNILSELIYPGALPVSQSQSKLSLVTTDTAGVVSGWYKEKVRELGLSATSTLFTQEEKKYLIKLSGPQSVSIEIEEENGQVRIEVSLD